MFYKIIEEDFLPLKSILEADAQSPITMWVSFGRIFMISNETETELMVRVNQDTITIARIQFTSQRNGYGSRVLNWLKEYARRNGQTKLKIECANTKEIVNFARKYGFVQTNDTNDWYICIDELVNNE
jgi:GNAT superfamily N-acetyltransferase